MAVGAFFGVKLLLRARNTFSIHDQLVSSELKKIQNVIWTKFIRPQKRDYST